MIIHVVFFDTFSHYTKLQTIGFFYMIARTLTELYLRHFHFLHGALCLCWQAAFCDKTKQLDKTKLKEKIRSYGIYNHENAIIVEKPLIIKDKPLFKTLTWVNDYSYPVDDAILCKYIELYKQVLKEVEDNLFILTKKSDKIAYANIILRDFNKSCYYNQTFNGLEQNNKCKEFFEFVLNRQLIFDNEIITSENDNNAVLLNYNLSVRLINHFDFIDRLIELFLFFEINLISIAEKTKYNLYIFNDSKLDNLSCEEFKRISNNAHPDNDKCKYCNNLYCDKSEYQKSNNPIIKDFEFKENVRDFQQNVIPKFNSVLSDDCLIKIMHYLANKKMLENPNSDSWLFWFNRKYLKVPEPLKWKGTPTMLSNIIQHFCGESNSTTIKTAFSTKDYVKPTRKIYESSKIHKEIEQIITISKQKNN